MSITATAIPPAVGSFRLSPSPRDVPRYRMAVRSNAVSVAPILTKLRKECATPLPLLRHVADAMAADMRAGLAVDGGSDLKMILSYVDNLPTGYVKNFALYVLSSCVCTKGNIYDLKGMREDCSMRWILEAQTSGC